MFTNKVEGDSLSMSTRTGQSYTAKLDGTEAPYKGDPGTTSVSVKKVDKNTIEETDKRDGKVISVARMTVAADGKNMTIANERQVARDHQPICGGETIGRLRPRLDLWKSGRLGQGSRPAGTGSAAPRSARASSSGASSRIESRGKRAKRAAACRRGCPSGRREASATRRAASRAWPTVRANRRAPASSTVVSGTRESQAAACRTASEALRAAEPSGPPAPARHRETSRSTGASPPTFVSARRRSRARTFVVPSQSGRT